MTDGHPDRGRLLAHLDGEMEEDARRELRRHLEGCRRCRERLEEVESHEAAFSRAASRLDRPMPDIPNPAAEGVPEEDAAGSVPLPPLRAAAAALLVLLGASALTPPGRALAERALDGIAGLFADEPAAPAEAPSGTEASREQSVSAVSAESSDGRLVVSVEAASPGEGPLRVSRGPGGRAVVEGAVRDVERGPGSLRVRVDSLAGLRIRMPDSVGSAEVRVDGRPVLRQRGRDLTPESPADTAHGEILIRVRP